MGTAAEGGGDLWATFLGDRFTGPGGGSCKRPLNKVSQGTGLSGHDCVAAPAAALRHKRTQACAHMTRTCRVMHTDVYVVPQSVPPVGFGAIGKPP